MELVININISIFVLSLKKFSSSYRAYSVKVQFHNIPLGL
jgi:hypothetical protein